MDLAAKAIQMEQLKQILRLQRDGFSINAIVRHTGISWPTVKKYLARIKDAAIDDNDLATLNSKELSKTVYNNNTTTIRGQRYTSLQDPAGIDRIYEEIQKWKRSF